MRATTTPTLTPILLTVALACGCARAVEDDAAAPAPTGTLAGQPTATDAAALAPVPVRLPLPAAEERMRAWIHDRNPDMNPDARFPLREITADDVWDELGVQVFQVTSGPREARSYVFRGETIRKLGEGLGGRGVVSMCAADVNDDGAPDLAFSYSFGSGIHRSHVAFADLAGDEIVQHVAPETSYLFEDLRVRRAAGAGAGVGDGVEVTLRDATVGRLVASDDGARIEFSDGFDPALLRNERR